MAYCLKYTVTSIGVILLVLQTRVCTAISHPNITGNAWCSGGMEFYADGVQYEHDNDNIRNNPSPINIPGTTRVVAIRCDNFQAGYGLCVYLSNDVRNDTLWKCSDESAEGWGNIGFDDSAWTNAKRQRVWIWTSPYGNAFDDIYCRKSISGGISNLSLTIITNCITMEFYTDGVRYEHDNDDDMWVVASHINIPNGTQVVAIKCKRPFFWDRFKVVWSNEVITDTSWKCSNNDGDRWNTLGFDDSGWTNATLETGCISTIENVNEQGFTYCRKSFSTPTYSSQTSLNEASTTAITVMEPCSGTATLAELCFSTTTVVEPCSPTTTIAEACSTVVELSTTTTTVVELTTATSTVVETCSPATTVVETCSPTTTIVEACSTVVDLSTTITKVVELSTASTTLVGPCSLTTTVVEPCSPTTTVVEPCSSTTTVVEQCSTVVNPCFIVVEPCSPTTTIMESCSPTSTVVEPCSSTTTIVEISTASSTVVELSTVNITVVEPCSPTTTVKEPCSSSTTIVEPCSTDVVLGTATTTVVELSTATTTVVESCSPTTTVVAPCSQPTTLVGPCSSTTTIVESCFLPTTSVEEQRFSTTSVVEQRFSTTSVPEQHFLTTSVLEPRFTTMTAVEVLSPTTTVVEPYSHISDFDLQPSSTDMAVLGSDGVLRSQVCQDVVVVTSESAMSEEVVSSIHKALTVDKRKISSVIRKKVSQKDDRPSSATIGYFGLIIAVLPFALIIISDIPKLIQHLKTLRPTGQC